MNPLERPKIATRNQNLIPQENPSFDRWKWVIFIFLLAVFFTVQYVPLSRIDFDDLTSVTSSESISQTIKEGDPKRQIALGALGLFAFLSLFNKRSSIVRINGALGWLVIFYLYWIFLSIIWANDPGLTFRRLVIFAFLCLGALAVVRHFPFEDLIRFTFLSGSIYLVIGFAVEIAHGRFHPFDTAYRFAGTFHPNYQGLNCALLLLSAIFLAKAEKRGTLFYYSAALSGFIFLVLTKSRTSLICAICALLLYWLLVLPASRKWHLALGVGWFGSLLLFLFSNVSDSRPWKLISLGREGAEIRNLTGRIPLWEECLKYFIKEPLLGYGYQGFWTPKRIDAISSHIGWTPLVSHSVYIDLLLDLGTIGMFVYVMINFTAIRQAHRHFRDSGKPRYAFIYSFLGFCLLNGFLESTLLYPTQLTFLSMSALASLAFLNPFSGEIHLQDYSRPGRNSLALSSVNQKSGALNT